MKIRNGFVSNSSSSSFVVAGLKVKSSDVSSDLREELWDKGFMVLSSSDDGIPRGYTVVGKEIAGGGDYMEYSEFSLEKLNAFLTKVVEEVNLPGEAGIFTGTRAC